MDIRYIQELHDKIKEYKQNKKKYTDKKVLAVYVLKTLQMYSTEELPLSYSDIMDYLESGVDGYKYMFSQDKKDTNRKKLHRIIQSLITAGFNIKKVKSKFWLAGDVDSILYGDVEKNAMFCFDSLVRNKYIDSSIPKSVATIEVMNKFNLEKFTPNSTQSIILNSQEPMYLENLFKLFRYIGKWNIRFEYPGENYNYRTYKISPYEIIYYDDNYYLIGKLYSYSKQITELSYFRVDLMEEISLSKKTEFSPIKSLYENNLPTEEQLAEETIFNLSTLTGLDVYARYYLYHFILKNLIGELISVEFTTTNPFEITEKKVIDVFGDSIKLNRKTHTYTLTNVPEKKFVDWAIANYENISIETANIKAKVEEKLKLYIQIRKVELDTLNSNSYQVALNLKKSDFNYRVFGVLESRKGKQIIIKCTKQNLSLLRAYITETKDRVVTSDISNINRNDFARMFHYKDI